MKIYYCTLCKNVVGFLDEKESILKLSGEDVTGFKKHELSKEELESLK